jgi:hypothetical protein
VPMTAELGPEAAKRGDYFPNLGRSIVAWKRSLLWRSSSLICRKRTGDNQAR